MVFDRLDFRVVFDDLNFRWVFDNLDSGAGFECGGTRTVCDSEISEQLFFHFGF